MESRRVPATALHMLEETWLKKKDPPLDRCRGTGVRIEMSSFQRKLRSVFNKAGEHGTDEANDRFVPRATAIYEGNWRVFDRLQDRFLTDREIKQIPEARLLGEQLPLN